MHNHHFPSFKSAKAPDEFMGPIQEILGGRKALLIGWSMGGMLTIETALRFPEHVAGVIGINTTSCFIDDDADLGWHSRILRKMKQNLKKNPDECLSKFIQSMFSSDDMVHELATKYRKEVLGNEGYVHCDFTSEGLMAGLDYLMTTDLRSQINRLQPPMLWIHGENDAVCPIKGFLNLRQSMSEYSHHRFKLFPKAGHASFFRYPHETVELIKEFIRATDN